VTCPYFAAAPADWLQWWQDRGQASKGAPKQVLAALRRFPAESLW
jgi:hypothetical protein